MRKKRNVWNIPETWEVSEKVRQILEEAMECVATDDSIELPVGSYVDSSFKLGIDDVEEVRDSYNNGEADEKVITDYVTREDIELIGKLENMFESEISEAIYDTCHEPEFFKKIEEEIWRLMNDNNEPFSKADFYEGLADEYDAVDEDDLKAAELYNCDLLYMVGIANVLGLKRPKDSGDFLEFDF